MKRGWLLAVMLSLALALHAQMELPPGTRPADEGPSQPKATDVSELASAEALLKQKQWPAAATALEVLLARSPKNSRAWFDLGYAREMSGDDTDAEKAYRSGAETAEPGDLRSAVALGLVLARKGDRAGAEQALTTAAAAENAEPELRARAYRAMGRLAMPAEPEKARTDMLAALKLSPETAEDVLLTAEIAGAMGDADAALSAYGRAFQMSPGSMEAAAKYGRALMRKGDFVRSEEVLSGAAEAHPEAPGVLAELAAVLLKQKKLRAAQPVLVKLHAADGANLAVTRLLAHTCAAQESWAAANPIYAELLHATPEDPVLLSDWGDALIRQQRFTEAEVTLKLAVSLESRFPARQAFAEAAGALAFAAENNGDPETVLRAGELRNSILEPDARTAFLLASAHDTLHHTRKAEELYRQFLDLAHGSFPDEEWHAQQRIAGLHQAK